MKLRIIDEKSGNPFKYFSDEYSSRGPFSRKCPREYKKPQNVSKVMKGLISQLDLSNDIDCLEVGAGRNPTPSNELSQLGLNVITLDLDWSSTNHTDISHEEIWKLLKKYTNKDIVIPIRGGNRGNVVCYLGDIAFLRDENSALRERSFDFIYFWGSTNGGGCNRAVEHSYLAKDVGVKIKYPDRMSKLISTLKKGGTILSISEHFSGHRSELIEDIAENNMALASLGLYWAVAGENEAKVIGFFTQSPSAVKKRLGIDSNESIEVLTKNPLDMIVETQTPHYNIFGKKNNYEKLLAAKNALNPISNGGLENLGLIDAVFVGY